MMRIMMNPEAGGLPHHHPRHVFPDRKLLSTAGLGKGSGQGRLEKREC